MKKLYETLATLVTAIENCRRTGNAEWERRHRESAEGLVRKYMPSGGGFDSGTFIDISCSSGDRLVFSTSFHHMTSEGFYDGWTSHEVVVTPSLASGINIRVGGRDRNQIKDYIHESFWLHLHTEVDAKPLDSAASV